MRTVLFLILIGITLAATLQDSETYRHIIKSNNQKLVF